MRVVGLIDRYRVGGAEVVLRELALTARELGLDFELAALDPATDPRPERALRELGLEPHTFDLGGGVRPSGVARVRRALAALSPDVVHTNLGTADMIGALVARPLGIPFVSTIHAVDWTPEGGWTARSAARHAAGVLARRRAARIVAVSAAARDAYVGRRWAPASRVTVVHNGVRAAPAAGAGRAVRAELGIGADELVVTMISALRPGKGHEEAIAAMGTLAGHDPPVRLVIVGDGVRRESLAAAAEPLGDRVILTGWRPDAFAMLDAADVLLHPSHFDAFPTTLLEALAAGTPILATRVGGIPEIVEDGRSGVLVDDPARLAEPLAALLDEPARRARLAAAGRERFAVHFAAEPWVRRMWDVYAAAAAR